MFLVVVCFATWSLKNQKSVSSWFDKLFLCTTTHHKNHTIKFNLPAQFVLYFEACLFITVFIDVTDSDISQLLILPGWSSTLIMISGAVLSIKVFLAYLTVKWYICIGLNLFCHKTFYHINHTWNIVSFHLGFPQTSWEYLRMTSSKSLS